MSPADALNTRPGNTKHVILVVDDESAIRDFLEIYLRSKNFKVLTAGNAQEALAVCEQSPLQIDLLLTDVVMPGLNGKMLADKLRATMPNLKVIFMSGYLPHEVAEETLEETFFKKPFHPVELLEAIRESLHSKG